MKCSEIINRSERNIYIDTIIIIIFSIVFKSRNHNVVFLSLVHSQIENYTKHLYIITNNINISKFRLTEVRKIIQLASKSRVCVFDSRSKLEVSFKFSKFSKYF